MVLIPSSSLIITKILTRTCESIWPGILSHSNFEILHHGVASYPIPPNEKNWYAAIKPLCARPTAYGIRFWAIRFIASYI